MKTIFRSNPQSQFTVIPNELLQSGLSSRALGILVRILSLPDDWQVHKSWLATNDGRDAINSAFAELEQAGYMRQIKPNIPKGGLFAPTIYLFTDKAGCLKDVSIDGFPSTGFRKRVSVNGKPTATKKPLQRTKEKEIITKKEIEISNNKEKEEEKEAERPERHPKWAKDASILAQFIKDFGGDEVQKPELKAKEEPKKHISEMPPEMQKLFHDLQKHAPQPGDDDYF